MKAISLSDAKTLYFRCSLMGLGVENAMELPEFMLEYILNARSLTRTVGFEEWVLRCGINVIDPSQLPPSPSAPLTDEEKEKANLKALGGLMSAFAGNTPPPVAPGEKAHVPVPKVPTVENGKPGPDVPIISVDNIPPRKAGPFDDMKAQGTN